MSSQNVDPTGQTQDPAPDSQDQGPQGQDTQDTGTGVQASQDPQQISRGTPVLELLESNATEVPLASPAPETEVLAAEAESSIGAFVSSAGTIVNIAKTAWDVMKDNAPTASVQSDLANAVPSGATLTDLSGWNPTPRRMRWRYYTNSTAGELIGRDFNSTEIFITCEWFFNGQYRGAGQYINAATIIASGDVAWGNTVNITASISNPLNVGTAANPVAALPVRIEVKESNVLQNRTNAWSGNIQGNGAGRLDPV